ncbi:MAG: monomeric [FeFe] hydrogenase [Clostridia bacterium]|nr:monomeric [FeFe] hydrogenase [Clostridia bacterium]
METKIFENRVEVIRYRVLRELARHAWEGHDAFTAFNDIANAVAKKGEPPMSCCIYKDRAIIAERMRIGLGDFHGSKDTVQVVSIACDECPKPGHMVTDLCRGCVAHNCKEACPRNAIAIDERGYSHIDKARCVECGRCAAACKYNAIINMRRPCERVCPTGAIGMDEDGAAAIDQDKCIVCGSCVVECPFGAMNDISGIIEVINAIKNKAPGQKIIAIVAPAVAVQFPGTSVGQVFSAIKALGFDEVVEVAQGADETALIEAEELVEKGFLTSSCCPAFVEYVNIEFPELAGHVSSTPSPMALTGRAIKKKYPDSQVFFIGPCIAKKWECKTPRAQEYIDRVLTFHELNALLASRDIDISAMEEMDVQDASSYGRGFAKSGGVTKAIVRAFEELGIEDFKLEPVIANGVAECRAALMRAKAGKLNGNFIEGMICDGGCIRGKGTLINKKNSDMHLDDYCSAAEKETLK